jgi:hypothetical protein
MRLLFSGNTWYGVLDGMEFRSGGHILFGYILITLCSRLFVFWASRIRYRSQILYRHYCYEYHVLDVGIVSLSTSRMLISEGKPRMARRAPARFHFLDAICISFYRNLYAVIRPKSKEILVSMPSHKTSQDSLISFLFGKVMHTS